MEFDMRGLKVGERRKLLEWYLREAPILETKANYEVFKFLKGLGEEDKEFTEGALNLLFGFGMEGEEEEPILIPKGKKEVMGYV